VRRQSGTSVGSLIVRRVVTGTDEQGASVFASDEDVAPLTVELLPGASVVKVWGVDEPVVLPVDGSPAFAPQYMPPAHGFRFVVVTLGPKDAKVPADLDLAAAQAEMEEKLPGLAALMEPDHPGTHTTDTVDFDVIIAGEVWLELDDGERKLLKTGDSVVLNGNRHSWHNESDHPCTMISACIGAQRRT
jgi:mannose-6-phosphate isomerase-like protein (cupin superfamily)